MLSFSIYVGKLKLIYLCIKTVKIGATLYATPPGFAFVFLWRVPGVPGSPLRWGAAPPRQAATPPPGYVAGRGSRRMRQCGMSVRGEGGGFFYEEANEQMHGGYSVPRFMPPLRGSHMFFMAVPGVPWLPSPLRCSSAEAGRHSTAGLFYGAPPGLVSSAGMRPRGEAVSSSDGRRTDAWGQFCATLYVTPPGLISSAGMRPRGEAVSFARMANERMHGGNSSPRFMPPLWVRICFFFSFPRAYALGSKIYHPLARVLI